MGNVVNSALPQIVETALSTGAVENEAWSLLPRRAPGPGRQPGPPRVAFMNDDEGSTFELMESQCSDDVACDDFIQATGVDGLILRVSTVTGPETLTQFALEAAHNNDIGLALIHIEDCNLVNDDELIELVEMEIAKLLSFYGFDESVAFVRDDEPKLDALLDAIDAEFNI